jgi:hypothetical protein
MSGFRDLNVYIEARNLVVKIYTLLKKFPDDERFAMCSQLIEQLIKTISKMLSGLRSSIERRNP